MLNELYRTLDYLQFLLVANSRHGTHSPFIYRFVDEILYAKTIHPSFEWIEQIRKEMLQSDVELMLEDFGSGNNNGPRKLKTVAARTARGAKYGRLLHRIIAKFQPQICLEIGTGTGITALYQGAAMQQNQVLHSIEGCSALHEIAKFNANRLGLQQVVFHHGQFDQVLPNLLPQLQRIDFAYIDGNHTFEATVRYFEWLLQYSHQHTIMVFDDIYWNEEMKNAWAHIKRHPAVNATIDIFAFGLVFFRNEQAKEDFTIRY
jgi:predicted O-methyltransferase YrrM